MSYLYNRQIINLYLFSIKSTYYHTEITDMSDLCALSNRVVVCFLEYKFKLHFYVKIRTFGISIKIFNILNSYLNSKSKKNSTKFYIVWDEISNLKS